MFESWASWVRSRDKYCPRHLGQMCATWVKKKMQGRWIDSSIEWFCTATSSATRFGTSSSNGVYRFPRNAPAQFVDKPQGKASLVEQRSFIYVLSVKYNVGWEGARWDEKECCSYCLLQRWLCNFCHCHRESKGHIPVYDNRVSNRKNMRGMKRKYIMYITRKESHLSEKRKRE